MLRKIGVLLRKIILGAFILYGYNLIAVSFNVMIPINFFTICFVGILGLPALFSLILLLVLVF